MLVDLGFWVKLNQLVKTFKPIVDTIGNVESHDYYLASCMLKLIQAV